MVTPEMAEKLRAVSGRTPSRGREAQLDSALHDAINLIVTDLRNALFQGTPKLHGNVVEK